MAAAASIFEILRHSTDPAADDALLSALSGAERATASAIVDALLARQSRHGLCGLISILHQLDSSLHNKLVRGADDFFAALRESASAHEEQVRLNVLQLIELGRLYKAAYLLENMFHDRSERVRHRAANVLCTLAEDMIQQTRGEESQSAADLTIENPDQADVARRIESRWRDYLQFLNAVEAGLAAYELHRQPRVVEAAMWFVDGLGNRFWTLTSVSGSRLNQTAVKLFASAGHSPRMASFAINALNYSHFRPQVAAALGRCTNTNFIQAWLTECWRLVQPKTCRAITATKEMVCMEPGQQALTRLSPDAQRFLPRWVIASGLPIAAKADILRRFLRCADYQGQLSTVWALICWNEPVATELLRATLTHADARLAGMVRLELARRRPMDFPLGLLIEDSPAAHVQGRARLAAPAPAATSFDDYWAVFDQLDETQKTSLGRQVMERTPLIHPQLRGYLNGSEAYQRVRALRIVAALDLAEEFMGQAYQLSRDPDSAVRSAAALVLAQIPSNTSRRILQQALQDEDPRVQANAVEALEFSGHDGTAAALLPKLASLDNRVRANAVKALLKLGVREAAETLLRMLADEDRAMRASGLWLVERMGLFALASRVQRLAAEDEDAHVRQRARTLVAAMGEETSAGATCSPTKAARVEAHS